MEELAPIATNLGVTEGKINSALGKVPEKPEKKPDPELTKAKYLSIMDMYYDSGRKIGSLGGIAKLAITVGVTSKDAKAVIKELDAIYNDSKPKEAK